MRAIVTCFCMLMLYASAQAAPEPIDLRAYIWAHRPLVIFTPHASFRSYCSLKKDLDLSRKGIVEREMVIIELVGKKQVLINGIAQPRDASGLYKQFEVSHKDFRIILVGKDGRIKLNTGRPLSVHELFDIIDEMPLRQQEMKTRGK